MLICGDKAPALQQYQVFGLTVASEIPLPELRPAGADGRCEVQIREGDVYRLFSDEDTKLFVRGEDVVLTIEGVARYLVRSGNEIIIHRFPNASDRNVRLFLLGSAFGALLHQRSILPLHANAIEINGQAALFMGHSGAGKSTLAAWFYDQGLRILADDVTAVRLVGDEVLASPGIPRLRLCPDALEMTGRTADQFEPAFDDREKYNVPTTTSGTNAIPISHVYLLSRGPVRKIEPLKGIAALDALISNTYRGRYLSLIGKTKPHLQQCLELVARLPIYKAQRRWGLAAFSAEAAAILAHVRAN